MSKVYTAKVSAKGGRGGRAISDDKKLDINLTSPGSNEDGVNPEQLFAAGYAACFGQALIAIAEKDGLKPESVTLNANVSLHKEDGGFHLSVELNGDLPGLSQDDAESLMEKGHAMCPYSKATRGNVEVKLSANGTTLKKAA